LGIAVRCPAGSGSYTDLSGLVMLHAAPYAHSLRPGAVISGDVSTGLLVRTVAGGTAQALLAHASSSTGQTSGVWGATESEEGGVGVVGRAEASSGKAYGIFGLSFSPGGTGVYGTAPSTGTVGIATDSGGYGVYGYSASGHGVHGKANAPDGYGIYSEGNAYVEGELFWDAKTSYVSVSAAAFSPLDDNYMYTNSGNTLDPTDMSSQYYYAPVQLPHGATVTKIEFYWSDLSGDYNGHCYLYRNDMQAGEDTLGTVDTSGSSGVGSSETSTITNSTIDNSQYAYYLGWDLDGGGDVEGYGVVIEYTITEPY
jgi:hypothetical protein